MGKGFLIRCDADNRNGYGHFSRCLNIARGIREKKPGARIVFLGHYDKAPASFIRKYGMGRLKPPRYLKEELKLARGYEYFILDSYLITQNYINAYVDVPMKFIMIDDFSGFDLSGADLVINHNLEAPGHRYGAKRACLGLKFFPVHAGLRQVRLANKGRVREMIRKVFIFMGAADKYGAGVKLTRVLDKVLKNVSINLITAKLKGKPAPSVNKNRIRYLPVSFEIEKYLKQADAVIGGGGLTKFDCAYSCIPNASLCQNKEQERESKLWARAGLTCFLGMAQLLEDNEGKVTGELKEFFLPMVRRRIVEHCGREFSMDSTRRLVQAILRT